MPVFIYDANAYDKLTEVEGARWRRHADELYEANRDKPRGTGRGYCFQDFKATWDATRGTAYEDVWLDCGEPPLQVIYGAGGYARYAVHKDGEIVLLSGSTTAERCTKARAAGFTVRETPSYGP